MLRTKWGPSSWANIAGKTRKPPDRRDQGEGQGQQHGRDGMIDRARSEGDDLIKRASKKKAYFKMLDVVGSNRKVFGKGNIVTFVFNTGINGIEKNDVSKVLRVGGFMAGQVNGITFNTTKSNEVEVLFGDAVKIDTLEIEKKIKADGMDVIVSKFDHVEEFLMIYGLPLSNNMDFVEKKIKEAIKPFVKKIIDVFPCVHKAETDDFFKGHFDGSWRVKVEPKMNRQVPNYIVVDSTAQVLAKAVYNKKVSDKQEMCADCFSTEHFKRSEDCSGPVKWSEYCKRFMEAWEDGTMEEYDEDQTSVSSENSDESRLNNLNKNMMKDVGEIQKKNKHLEGKMFKQRDLYQKIDDLSSQLENAVEVSTDLSGQLKVLQEETKPCMTKIFSLYVIDIM